MAAWDNPVAAPSYGAPLVDFSQLADLAKPLQQRQQQQQTQQPGQPLNLQPQLPLAQRLAALLGGIGQPQASQGTSWGQNGNMGGVY